MSPQMESMLSNRGLHKREKRVIAALSPTLNKNIFRFQPGKTKAKSNHLTSGTILFSSDSNGVINKGY